MRHLDPTDRQLIAALKLDGRASVTTLAGQLGVSRATVQNRLTRLVSSGVIQRFTVEPAPISHQDHIGVAVPPVRPQGEGPKTMPGAS